MHDAVHAGPERSVHAVRQVASLRAARCAALRNGKSGDAMADNDKAKLRYDDFISNVHPDPAKPESTIMLSGFIGHGPEGHARIYPDPTLGTWYDVPEGDVVHSTPIPDSRLGGSYVWVRASAQIKPGSAAPPAAAGGGNQPPAAAVEAVWTNIATRCICAAQPAAAAPQAAAAVMQPTPATHCFICPPVGGLTVNATQCICQMPGRFDTPQCPTPQCPTMFWCMTAACTVECAVNGVFTPFGR
jgi:hypothetical protein